VTRRAVVGDFYAMPLRTASTFKHPSRMSLATTLLRLVCCPTDVQNLKEGLYCTIVIFDAAYDAISQVYGFEKNAAEQHDESL
jgi:hypothetical protein